MTHEGIAALKSEFQRQGWTASNNTWVWTKQNWTVVFDTSSWLELYVGDFRSHDVPVPDSFTHAAWTVGHIEYLMKLEEQIASNADTRTEQTPGNGRPMESS